MSKATDMLFVERYRPTELEDCILPKQTYKAAAGFIKSGSIPNLLLTGPAGTGKTTLAKVLCEKLDYEWLMINGSNEGRSLDTLRNTIATFASSMSFDGSRKCVIVDEADHIPDLTQAAMRNFVEEYHTNCSFIFTCNYPNKIIEPLHSRCSRIDFSIPKDEKDVILLSIFKRVVAILEKEQIEYDKKSVMALTTKFFPDFRRVLNEIQRYSATGKIDAGILVNTSESEFNALVTILKEKNFTEMRKWVASSTFVDMSDICRKLYDNMGDQVIQDHRPQLVLTLADYQYKHHFVMDQEINIVAMLTSIMMQVDFK